jgi:hypothetical protein
MRDRGAAHGLNFSRAVGGRGISYWAWRLDSLLNRRIGAPYRAILAIGLVLSIGASSKALRQSFHSAASVLVIVATALFQIALLINQLAQIHQRRRARLRRRAMRPAP